jgi:hypothetical protein
MSLSYLDLLEYLDEDSAQAFHLDDLYHATGGHSGLKLSDEWKRTMLAEAARKRDMEHERTKAKSKSTSKA